MYNNGHNAPYPDEGSGQEGYGQAVPLAQPNPRHYAADQYTSEQAIQHQQSQPQQYNYNEYSSNSHANAASYPSQSSHPKYYQSQNDGYAQPERHETIPLEDTETTNKYAPRKDYHSTPETTSEPYGAAGGPSRQSHDHLVAEQYSKTHPNDPVVKQGMKLDKKWQRRLYWMVPLAILAVVLVVLFEVYKTDFERWLQPLANWLQARESWSWAIPVAILVVLSFPPLFGHEIVQLVVGLAFPLGIAIGIAIAGAILGEAACFVVFKYFFTSYVDKKIAAKVKWAAIARICNEAGFRGVLVIRYSIVPPHLANPLFSCTGMKFWLYMVTVILSLPKSIVFVILGTPSSEKSKNAKYGKVAAVGVLVIVTIAASVWIRKKMKIAIEEIEAERAESQGYPGA